MLVNKLQLKIRYSNCVRIKIEGVVGAGIGVRFMFLRNTKLPPSLNSYEYFKKLPVYTNKSNVPTNTPYQQIREKSWLPIYSQIKEHNFKENTKFMPYFKGKKAHNYWLIELDDCICDPYERICSAEKLKCIQNLPDCYLINCKFRVLGFFSHDPNEPINPENGTLLYSGSYNDNKQVFKRLFRIICNSVDFEGQNKMQSFIPYAYNSNSTLLEGHLLCDVEYAPGVVTSTFEHLLQEIYEQNF